jgi:hypothetical protein
MKSIFQRLILKNIYGNDSPVILYNSTGMVQDAIQFEIADCYNTETLPDKITTVKKAPAFHQLIFRMITIAIFLGYVIVHVTRKNSSSLIRIVLSVRKYCNI